LKYSYRNTRELPLGPTVERIFNWRHVISAFVKFKRTFSLHYTTELTELGNLNLNTASDCRTALNFSRLI